MERYKSVVGMAAALLLATAWAGGVTAQDAAAKAEAPKAESKPSLAFEDVDTNHDGFISRSEVPKSLNDLRAHFDQYDQNHDHRLSKEEYMAALASLDAQACKGDQNMATAKCNLGTVDNGAMQRQSFQNIPVRNAPPPPAPRNK
ncbi:EF-hand domain-containing protein [Dyella subtropica]|uniref:EF-hand domain-containing protein n=1 Tax=Dyella subtropica TaxID=2992127 RepID=UPI002259D3F4|nr:EF-hand domain-containing protein [Dyella subtropica]